MSETKADLLFEIGCEELPASFVEAAIAALPGIADKELGERRLGRDEVVALGTPRRLALLVRGLERRQSDLEEEITGPPVSAAFKDGKPTQAAEAFARKLGCAVGELGRVQTDKGEYLRGTRREQGRPAVELLPDALCAIATSIPFRKSMRWGSGSLTFGRPIRWLVALMDGEPLPVRLGDIEAGTSSHGHRFLHPGEVAITGASSYVEALRRAHVLVDPVERAARMKERLSHAATQAGGVLVEDEFLVGENLSLVEDPQVIVGGFDEEFLELPEEVILEVARGHQRYFGLRGQDGKLMARYLAVVNTAENEANIRLGNDRVMRARLADARFFYREDLKKPLAARRPDLAGIVFQNRLGTVLAKTERIERLTGELCGLLGLDAETRDAAVQGAALCKCDLVTYMVGEFPELQGEVGRAYALKTGVPQPVANVIRDHYRPKGAKDDPAPALPAAIVALADRLDTMVGCFGVGLSPTGGADPYGLRRACIGSLRTLLAHDLDLRLGAAFDAAFAGYQGVALDLDAAALRDKLGSFFRDRLRGLLCDELPADVVDAALGVAADRPLDARRRADAIVALDPETRARLGEVFKRATNIAKDAPTGEPRRGAEPDEQALHDAFYAGKAELERASAEGDYQAGFRLVADLCPTLADYFDKVLVMAEDAAVRDERLRLMRVISETASSLAHLERLSRSA